MSYSPRSGDRLDFLAGGELGRSLSEGSYLFLLPLSVPWKRRRDHFMSWRRYSRACPCMGLTAPTGGETKNPDSNDLHYPNQSFYYI